MYNMDGIFAFKEVCFKVILPALNETEKKNEILHVGYYTHRRHPVAILCHAIAPLIVLMSSVISLQVGACLEKIRVTD